MSTTTAYASHLTQPPITISLEKGAGSETTMTSHGYTAAPKIVCSLPDDSVDASVPGLSSDSDFSSSSSTSSSPKSTRSSFPSLESDDAPIIKSKDNGSLCYDFKALNFDTGRTDFQSLIQNDGQSHLNPQKPHQRDAAPSPIRVTRNQRSFSKTIAVNLTYPDNLAITNQAPKIHMMDTKVNFQVLIGSLAQLLSISPELFDLTIQGNSRTIRLSPIASPHQLGFSGDLTIQVWVRKVATEAHSNLPESLDQPRRIPGTKWIHSFPSKKYKLGLPSSPKFLGNSVSM
ncbi:hypothetical protein PGT21_030958 [Puccinia graminis f. sp. tritici]|uniref:Uncharacterized protein n=1 Tax=Puccinia graminis f. sp. tritici TaxID=56615 RepID=A0A5B0QC06_PUCGR|nr:hypothetical protein PGT21_030958 [Puccinia graminis f. sp. tritici]